MFSYRLRRTLVSPIQSDIGLGLEGVLASTVNSVGRLTNNCNDLDVSVHIYTFGHIHM